MKEGALSEYHKGWATATIGELVDKNGVFIDGDWVESKDQDPSGDVRLVQLADIGDGVYRNKSNRFLTSDKAVQLGCTFLKNDDVLIARMPDPLGRACLFPGDQKPCVTVVDVCIVRVSTNFANNRWLMYAINSHAFRSEISSLQSGTTRKRISRGNLSKLELPLPPIPEQRAIVSKIEQLFSDLDNGIENFKKAQAHLNLYRQAVLKKAFEGDLTKKWREKQTDLPSAEDLIMKITNKRNGWIENETLKGNNEAKRLRTKAKKHIIENPNESIPDMWIWASFLQACHLVVDCHNKTAPYQNTGICLVRTSNIRDGKLNIRDDIRYISEDTYEYWSRRCPPKPGDILFTREAPMGEAAIIPPDIKICMGQRMVLLRAFDELLSSKYLLYAILDLNFQKRLRKNAIGTGVKHLRVGDVEKLLFPLCPIKEQSQIVSEIERRLSVSDKMEAIITESLKKADSLRQSILKKAFEGKLLNKNELEKARNAPDWEPAEKLLERIRQEKARTGEKKRKR